MGGPGSGPRPLGRPTKLTPEIHREVVQYIEAGNYLETAAAVAGVAPSTLRLWLKKGRRNPDSEYGAFSAAVKRAEARAEASALVRVRQAGKKNWTAEAWYLERKFPTKWGRWDRVGGEAPPENDGSARALRRKDVRDLLDQVAARLGMEGDSGSSGEPTQ